MRKRIVALLGAAVVCALAAGSAAAGEPSAQANCNGLFSALDAQDQFRDDVAHIHKAIATEEGIPPGFIPSFFAHERPCLL
jgi:hypothetical protein